jgi:hypothetical protein
MEHMIALAHQHLTAPAITLSSPPQVPCVLFAVAVVIVSSMAVAVANAMKHTI